MLTCIRCIDGCIRRWLHRAASSTYIHTSSMQAPILPSTPSFLHHSIHHPPSTILHPPSFNPSIRREISTQLRGCSRYNHLTVFFSLFFSIFPSRYVPLVLEACVYSLVSLACARAGLIYHPPTYTHTHTHKYIHTHDTPARVARIVPICTPPRRVPGVRGGWGLATGDCRLRTQVVGVCSKPSLRNPLETPLFGREAYSERPSIGGLVEAAQQQHGACIASAAAHCELDHVRTLQATPVWGTDGRRNGGGR